MTTANGTGVFCVSVDCWSNVLATEESIRRRAELVAILQQFDIPSNWTMDAPERIETPLKSEITVGIPRSMTRGELVQHLRSMTAVLPQCGSTLSNVAVDPAQALSNWDVLVRRGCFVARPCTADSSTEIVPKVVRGGLWLLPITCSFIGGSRRTVRTLFSICQRRLMETVRQGRLFHLNINVGNSRDSWPEEADALRALLRTARDQQAHRKLRFANLSELPRLIVKRQSPVPLHSILHRAA